MIKWIKNQYYMWLNRLYNAEIKDLYMQYITNRISKLCYLKESQVYKDLINENLKKIRL